MARSRIISAVTSLDGRIALSFFIFGLLNNVFGVIIISAALDLVGPHIPKGAVLISNIIPCLVVKLTLPYVIGPVPYSTRVIMFSAFSTVGMLILALTPSYSARPGTTSTPGSGDSAQGSSNFALSVGLKVLGIVLASLSGGIGEISYLSLTHFYGEWALAAWSSGTGAAGLVGAGAYAIITGPMGVSVRKTLLASSIWPFGMAAAFFWILPRAALEGREKRRVEGSTGTYEGPPAGEGSDRLDGDDDMERMGRSDQGLLEGRSSTELKRRTQLSLHHAFWVNLQRARPLIVPFMIPLFLVYLGEYTINQGVAPTLLFPLPSASTPFEHYREFYPMYATIYQIGVFLSRSSIFFPSFRLHALYLPSLLQLSNLLFLIAQAIWNFIPNVWIIFAIVLWEGLLGGAVYVNTFAEILERVPDEDREFSLGASSVSDSLGVTVAAFLGMALEMSLCRYQVSDGRDSCTKL